MAKTIRTMLIITGVKSPQILGPGSMLDRNKEIEQELGIEFVD